MDEKPKASRGRPAKHPGERRTSHTFRLRDTIRQQIIQDAQSSGRSLSEEIEWKVESAVRWEQARGAASLMAEADLLSHEAKEAEFGRLCAQLDYRRAVLPNGLKILLDPGQVAQLGPRMHDPAEVLRFLGAEASYGGKAAVIQALRETLKPEFLQPQKGEPNEGEHNPPRA
jgi:hypothetical protein